MRVSPVRAVGQGAHAARPQRARRDVGLGAGAAEHPAPCEAGLASGEGRREPHFEGERSCASRLETWPAVAGKRNEARPRTRRARGVGVEAQLLPRSSRACAAPDALLTVPRRRRRGPLPPRLPLTTTARSVQNLVNVQADQHGALLHLHGCAACSGRAGIAAEPCLFQRWIRRSNCTWGATRWRVRSSASVVQCKAVLTAASDEELLRYGDELVGAAACIACASR